MIKIHLSRLLGERKDKIADLQRLTGLSRNTLAGLYHEDTARIDLATLNAICKHYECSVADLLEYQPDPPSTAEDGTEVVAVAGGLGDRTP